MAEPSPRSGTVIRLLPISVVVPALDEGDRIADCVKSAAQWADEVIVVDGGSRDRTADIAREAGATVYVLTNRTIGAQRNVGADAARNDWIFALDTDERASEQLIAELRSRCARKDFEAYRVRMRNFYLGRERKHGRWGRDWHSRVYRKGLRFTESRVHERLEHGDAIGTLDGHVLHTPYRDLSHHIAKMRVYARLGALDLHARGKKASATDLVVRPVIRFLRDYLVYGSILEGRYGFVTSALTGYCAFLKYAFLYELANSDVPQSGRAATGSSVSR
ncbi:MAG: glycosyltransferase family 2 protein [Gemmatimonadota bacterium]|nr:glycosyltransferase family 2 protein [Gemmatimonadota bacterium]